jgi:hypothetical protein
VTYTRFASVRGHFLTNPLCDLEPWFDEHQHILCARSRFLFDLRLPQARTDYGETNVGNLQIHYRCIHVVGKQLDWTILAAIRHLILNCIVFDSFTLPQHASSGCLLS